MKTQFFQNKIIIGSLSFSVLLASIGTSMANIVLPAIALDFGVPFSKVKWVILSYLLATTVFSLIVGRLGDRHGRRKMLLWGMIFFVFGTILSAISPVFWLFIVARSLQGIGAAALIVLPVAIITELGSKQITGRMIGLLATMSAIGTAAGPSLGGLLLSFNSWRATFFLVAALGFLGLLLSLIVVSSNVAKNSDVSQSRPLFETLKFVLQEPFLRIRLFSNLVVTAVMMSTLIAGPFYLTHNLKIAPVEMGLIMSVGPITSVVFGIISGYLADRFGFFLILMFGFLQIFIGALAFAVLPRFFGVSGFVISAMLLSLGYQLFLSSNSSCIMKNLNDHHRGFVSGALSLSRNAGLLMGTFVMGTIFENFGLNITFLFAATLVGLLLLTQWNIQKGRTNGKSFASQVH